MACHFPVETVDGSIVGPRPDEVGPILPDTVERPQALGVVKELGGEMGSTRLQPTKDDGIQR